MSEVNRVESLATVVPITIDESTFHDLQKKKFREIEKKMEEDIRRKKKDWEREVERMKEEFLELHPANTTWNSGDVITDPCVSQRRGSTDVLNIKKMKTAISEHPDCGRRFKLRFNVRAYEHDSVKVGFNDNQITVTACKKTGEDGEAENAFVRKIEKPKEVDAGKLKSFLTKDGVLIIDAPLPPKSLDIQKPHSPSHNSSTRSQSPSNSAHSPSSTGSGYRVGVPQFDGEPDARHLTLVVDIGLLFKPREITVQIIKDNRIQVKAKHEERTSERMMKSKFNKEYELSEKISPFSLRAGLTEDGMLLISAVGKGCSQETAPCKSSDEGGKPICKDAPTGGEACNVLDLASFPPSHVVNNNAP